MTAREYAGAAATTALSVGISNSDMSFTVAAGGGSGYPDGATAPFVVCLDLGQTAEEKILCESRSGDTFTVATGGRGWDDTTAASHTINARVDHVATATDLREANEHINASSGVHGRSGAMVGTTDTQTLTNKTLTTPTIGSFTNAQHDHSNAAGGAKLAQANTHQSPDTDASTSALHHTLGTGANQAAAGNHTHAASGGVIAATYYDPASQVTKSNATSTFAAFDTTNLRVTFTAPASGNVIVRFGVNTFNSTGAAMLGVLEGATVRAAAQSSRDGFGTVSKLITGLTPGNSYSYDLAHATNGSGTCISQYGGGVSSSGYGPAFIEIVTAP